MKLHFICKTASMQLCCDD